MKTVEFVVKVEGQFPMAKAVMLKKVRDWIEHYGHTSSSFGFEFKEVRRLGDDE